jgi:hypothetical protein
MPSEMLENINRRDGNVFGPQDVRIPLLNPPPGDIDVLFIVESGSEYSPRLAPTALAFISRRKSSSQEHIIMDTRTGKGISLEAREGLCIPSFCSRLSAWRRLSSW